jgi:PAS domain S-box-containing protein
MNRDPIENEATTAREVALRASDSIIEISADAIITINEDQEIIRYNNGAEEIFGYTREEIIGKRIDLLIPARFRANHPAQVRSFAASPVVARRMGERRQISGLRKNGDEFPAEASISKTRIGDEWLYTVALRDVSDRVRAERGQQFLAQATELLNKTLDAEKTIASIATLSIPLLGDWCVVILRRNDGAFYRAVAVHANPARTSHMEGLAAIPFTPHADHLLLRCLHDGQPILQPDFDAAAIEKWSNGPEHYRLLREIDPASLIAVPLPGRGQHTGAICFFSDRSSARRHDADDLQLAGELARRAGVALDNARLYGIANSAVAARDEMLAVVSHDLGNPLAAIRLSSTVLDRMLSRNASANAEAQEQVQNIRSSVHQMDRLIKDLLDIHRIESGFLALETESISVSELLDDVLHIYQPLAASRGIAIECRGIGQDVRVTADRERVLQVFSNLVGNALKFCRPGQGITLSARALGEIVEFTISDTGPGIPAEHIDHIFDRFWQVRRTGRQGIGLGLAIVKGIIDAHSGTVHVSSELGSGTAFTFTLPVSGSVAA